MKKTRKIIIKNPRLQYIRNNLRKIIVLATKSRMSILRHQERLYCENRDAVHNTPSQQKRERYLLNKRYELGRILKRSICSCFSGNQCSNQAESDTSFVDMVYVAYEGAWYCIMCYEGMEQMWKFHEQHRKEFICELREAEGSFNARLIKKLSNEVLNGELTPKECDILLRIGSTLKKDRKWVKDLLSLN